MNTPTFLNTKLYLTYLAIMCVIQLIPLTLHIHFDGDVQVLQSLRDPTVHLVAAFSLGFLSLIFMNLFIDLLTFNFNRVISRSFYLWVAISYSIITLFFRLIY
jgi:hypothetical protein